MRRTWAAAIAAISLTLVSAFTAAQINSETGIKDDLGRWLIESNRILNNYREMPQETPAGVPYALYASRQSGNPQRDFGQSTESDEKGCRTAYFDASNTDRSAADVLHPDASHRLGTPARLRRKTEALHHLMPYAQNTEYSGMSAAADSGTDTDSFIYSDDYITCIDKDNYDEGETTCYVDSVNGNDTNDGFSEASPVKSQSAVDPSCSVVRFKRGSFFNEKLATSRFIGGRLVSNVKVFTNYGPKSDPLPHFKVSSEPGRGPVVLSWVPLTIDGLHFSGARGDNTMEHDFDFDGDGITKGIVGGIGAFLGAPTKFIHNEINNCDIGIMLGVPGSVVRGNYVHDLIMGIDDDPGVDPNLVGGAEGIFINASDSEVSYNTFVNCTGPAKWVGTHGECDGGATEVSARSGGVIENVHVHHNFSYKNCGFFEVASYFGDEGKGLFKDSSFHNNVIVDSAWMGLLQVNNIDLENVHFYNNTLIQRPGSLNAGILWIIFTSTSSGMEGGELVPGTVHLTNNLFVLHGVTSWFQLMDPAFVNKNNILASYSGPEDPNYVDLGFANIEGIAPEDFDLASPDSPAVNAGVDISGNTLDHFNRARPCGSAPDIGAMEFGAAQVKCIPRFPTASIGSPFEISRDIRSPFRPSRPSALRRKSAGPRHFE